MEEILDIRHILKKIPVHDINDYLIEGRVKQSFPKIISSYFPDKNFNNASELLISKLNKHGFLLVKNYIPEDSTIEQKLFYSSVICSLIGNQFKVISSSPIWNSLGVKNNKKEYESEGLGYNCVHIDVPNTTLIPRITILFCERADFYSGGETLLADFHLVLAELLAHEIERCKEAIFFEGRHHDLINVGSELSPFPILKIVNDKVIFRFSGKMKFDSRNSNNFELLKKIENILLNKSIVFLLNKNEILFIDQERFVHGRLPLKGDQSLISRSKQRSIYQSKLLLKSLDSIQ